MPFDVVREYLKITKLVWPLALGMMNNAVMQFVDRAFLSWYSLTALEAVLPAGMLMWVFAGFFQAIVGYSSVFVGMSHGAKDNDGTCSAYRAAGIIALGATLLSLPLIPLGEWILSNSSFVGEALSFAKEYYAIVMGGAFAVYGQMAASAYFTGIGRTRVVFWVNLLGNVLNIVLDLVLIFVFDMGIVGAAWATVISMFVQMLVLWVMAEIDVRIAKKHVNFSSCRALVGKTLRLGVPSGVYSVVSCLAFTFFVFITGGVGEFELAVSNACFTVNYLFFAPMEGFSLGASTLVAQAIGAHDIAAARRFALKTVIIAVVFTIVLSAVAIGFSPLILSVFAAKAGERAGDFISLGRTLFFVMAAWLVFDGADTVLSGALKGAGDTKFVMSWMFISTVLWIPVVFFVRSISNTMPALWAAQIVYVALMFAGSAIRWHRGSALSSHNLSKMYISKESD